MSSRSLVRTLLALSLAASGCATGGGASGEVDARIARLEREIDAMKRGASGTPAASSADVDAPPPPAGAAEAVASAKAEPAPPPAAETKPAEKPLLVWHVTPDITFKPGLRLQTRYEYDTRSNKNDVSIARFRLKASGDVYEVAKYGLELKIDNTGTGPARARAPRSRTAGSTSSTPTS